LKKFSLSLCPPISASLSTIEQQNIISAIATISQQLPFLVDLGLDERRSMTKLGDRPRSFNFQPNAKPLRHVNSN
jgi:hypothetical protein